MLREGWLIQQRREPIGKVSRMNQHHRLPGSPDFVLKFNGLEEGPIHSPRFHDPPPLRSVCMSRALTPALTGRGERVRASGPVQREVRVRAGNERSHHSGRRARYV